MTIFRVVMLVATVCLTAGSMLAAQGRGHGPAGHGPQTTSAGSGPNGSVSRAPRGGGNRNPGATPGNGGGGHGDTGTNPGSSQDHDGPPPDNVAGGSNSNRGNGSAGRGHGPDHRGGNPADGRVNPGRGDDSTDEDEGVPGAGRGRDGSSRNNGHSFVAKMNPQLRARLEGMLPSGMTLEQAAQGFRNRGQFIAALQQSHNHDISFVDLKTAMTGEDGLTLGHAVRKLRVKNDED